MSMIKILVCELFVFIGLGASSNHDSYRRVVGMTMVGRGQPRNLNDVFGGESGDSNPGSADFIFR